MEVVAILAMVADSPAMVADSPSMVADSPDMEVDMAGVINLPVSPSSSLHGTISLDALKGARISHVAPREAVANLIAPPLPGKKV